MMRGLARSAQTTSLGLNFQGYLCRSYLRFARTGRQEHPTRPLYHFRVKPSNPKCFIQNPILKAEYILGGFDMAPWDQEILNLEVYFRSPKEEHSNAFLKPPHSSS